MKTIAMAGLLLVLNAPLSAAGDPPMGFFVSSVGMGQGGNLGGLAGADAHCKKLAEAAGSKDRTWRAYLSTQIEGKRGISARERIGLGPWYNAKGELIASDLDQLHLNPNIVKRTALDENGNRVNGRGDTPNDLLGFEDKDGSADSPQETQKARLMAAANALNSESLEIATQQMDVLVKHLGKNKRGG